MNVSFVDGSVGEPGGQGGVEPGAPGEPGGPGGQGGVEGEVEGAGAVGERTSKRSGRSPAGKFPLCTIFVPRSHLIPLLPVQFQ